jgi:hypothetical protein
MRSRGSGANSDIPFRAFGGRVIGRIRDGVLVRRVGPKEHFRKLDAWPLGQVAADRARRLGVRALRYIASDGTYEVPFEVFLRDAQRLPFDHETQLVLPRGRWRFTPQPHRQPPQQQGLFEA